MGETCSVLILAGGIFMVLLRIANWRTIVSCMIAAAICSFSIYGGHSITDRLYLTAFALLSGGFLFGAIFMATDPITGPGTQAGRYFYGFAIGIIAIVIRRFSGYPEGIMFAILLMNIFAPLIDELVVMFRYRGVKQ